MATEVLKESYLMATGYAAVFGAPPERQHLFARNYDQPVTVDQLARDWAEFNKARSPETRVVIARTVEQARIISLGLAQPGAEAVSPLSIKAGAVRGRVVHEVLVDESVWPLDSEVLDELVPATAGTAATWWIRRSTGKATHEWTRGALLSGNPTEKAVNL